MQVPGVWSRKGMSRSKSQTAPVSAFDELRKNLPKLDKAANKQATRIFPPDWRIEFKSPLLLISSPSAAKWDIKLDEAKELVERTVNRELHNSLVSLSDNHFFITTARESSYYGRNVDITAGSGIAVIVTKCLIVGFYDAPTLPTEFIPLVESFATTMRNLGY